MALVKQKTQIEKQDTHFDSLQACLEAYYAAERIEEIHTALEAMGGFSGGKRKLVSLLGDEATQKVISAYIAMLLSRFDPKEAPIEEILELLKSNNAYVRNLAISVLRDYGQEIKYYIVKYLIGSDRDLRIFAINVLGDVRFPESRDMLLELLENEQDVNVAMTAVDYLAEIGQEEDIAALEALKRRFSKEPYVEFAISRAMKVIKG